MFAFYMAWKEVDFKTAAKELAECCGQAGTAPAPLTTASVSQALPNLQTITPKIGGQKDRAAAWNRDSRFLAGAPAHDLTDFWKSGGNLRRWVAEHVVSALQDVQHPRLKKILKNARAEVG